MPGAGTPRETLTLVNTVFIQTIKITTLYNSTTLQVMSLWRQVAVASLYAKYWERVR